MKIIDAHIHTSFFRKDEQEIAKKNGIDYSMEGLRAEMKRNNVAKAIALANSLNDSTPIGKTWLLQQLDENKDLIGVCGINPLRTTTESISETRKLLKNGTVKGLKIYLGYYSAYPFAKAYNRVYSLAEEFDCPVIFHTGDTLSTVKGALVKYAHPLHLDEVAVAHPNMKIILAHAGFPWMLDAAEVAYKNKKVHVDISGWTVGNRINPFCKRYFQELFEYVGPDKVLYGTDWPLVKMETYLRFFKSAIPKKYWNRIFYQNAARLFGLK